MNSLVEDVVIVMVEVIVTVKVVEDPAALIIIVFY